MADQMQQLNELPCFLIGSNGVSLLQYFAWIGTAIGALIAGESLRRSAKQARANFFLSLNPLWKDLKEARHEIMSLSNEVMKKIGASSSVLAKDAERLQALCEEYRTRIDDIGKMAGTDPDALEKLYSFYAYLNFFEMVGLMVRNRYVQIRDVYLLYKGPIIEIDYAFRFTIPQWQQRFDLPEGLYENLLYLIKRVHRYGKWDTLLRFIRFRK